MAKAKLTVSLPREIALYLRSQPNASAVVAEAVASYRARQLERTLENAYQEDAEEAAALDREWSRADAELPE